MKYFLDCGTHFFEGFNQFDQKYNFDQNWKIFSFEANPRTYELSQYIRPNKFNMFNYEHHNLAVSDKDGTVIINCDMGEGIGTGDGSNILEVPPPNDSWKKFTWEKEKIKSFNLSNFILNLDNVDMLIIKLDIEGAEFSVLEKIIEDQSYKKINKMYIEFHERFFQNEVQRYTDLKDKYCNFLKSNNVEIELWF